MAHSTGRRRFWKPFRSALSFLSDLQGAMVAVAAGAAVVIAAVVLAFNFLPTPGLFALGFGLIAFGLVLRLAGPALRMPPSLSSEQTAAAQATADAAALALGYRQGRETTRQEASQRLRRSSRLVREELLDHLHLLERHQSGGNGELDEIKSPAWATEQEVLLDHDDATPHARVSEAHRLLAALIRSQYDYSGGLLMKKADPTPLDSDVEPTIDAINRAVTALEGLEQRSGQS